MALSAVLLQKRESFFQEFQQKSQRRISFAKLRSHGHIWTNHWGTGHETLVGQLGSHAQSWISGKGVSQTIRSPKAFTGVGSYSLLQWIFPTQGFNPGLPDCRGILYQLSHQRSPSILEWVAYPFSSGSSQPRNQTGVSCIARGLFTSWATREALEQCWAVKNHVCVWDINPLGSTMLYYLETSALWSPEVGILDLTLSSFPSFFFLSFFFFFVAPGHTGY